MSFKVAPGYAPRFVSLFLIPAVIGFIIGTRAFSDDPNSLDLGNFWFTIIWILTIIFTVLTTIAVVVNKDDFK